MKTSWPAIIGAITGIAALVLSALTLIGNMNGVSVSDQRRLENRLTILEQQTQTDSKQIDGQGLRIDANAGKLADYNIRLDRLERRK